MNSWIPHSLAQFSAWLLAFLSLAGALKGLMDECDPDITIAKKAVPCAIGEYVRHDQFLQPPAQDQLSRPVFAVPVRQQAREGQQLDHGANLTGGSTLKEISNAAARHMTQQPGEISAATGGPLMPASGATPANSPSEPELEAELESQLEGPCPRCHSGRGTVSRHHLCRCRQCPNSPWHNQCPFCTLVDVPLLKRPLKTKEGTCPCCCARPGIPKEGGHICFCHRCENIPDAVCRHCALNRVPIPKAQLDGACPCCLERQGRVATQHMCLCEGCKMIPGSVCPFCLFAELSMASIAFAVMVFYSLTMW
jgi:hypothetical protein